MPNYFKLFYSSSQEIPLSFYDNFDVISKLEFPTYQEILIKHPFNYSKQDLIFKFLSLNLPLPLFFHVKDYRNEICPLHYSKYELHKLKMYNLIK